MPIVVACGACGKKYSVGDHLAGKRGKCKACGAVFSVPVGGAGAPVKSAPARQFDEESSLDPSEPDLSALSAVTESGVGTSVAESIVAVPKAGPGDEPDSEESERSRDADDEFAPRATKGLLGPAEAYLPKILLALGVGVPTLLSIKFALDRPSPWIELSGLGAMLLLVFLLILPVSMIGLRSSLRKLRIGMPSHAKSRLLGAIAMPLGGVILGYWMGGPQGMIAGALGGLIPGAVALAYQFGLNVTEAAVTVAGVAATWVVSTGVAVAFAYGTGFAVNAVVHTVQERHLVPVAVAPTTKAVKPIVLAPSTLPVSTQPTAVVVSTTAPPVPDAGAVTAVEVPLGPSKRELSSENLVILRDTLLSDAKAHDGLLAPDLATLSSRAGLPASVLDSPVGRASTGSDYLYLFSGVTMQLPLRADIVVAYDYADAEQGDGANVLMGDGRVTFVGVDVLKGLLTKTRDALPPPGAILEGVGRVIAPKDAPPVRKGVTPVVPVVPVAPVHDPVEAPTSGDRPTWVKSIDMLPIEAVANDVLLPSAGSSFVGVVTHGANEEETVQRFNVLTREAGPKVTFKRDPNAPSKYVMGPTGDVVVRISSWPRLSAQVWSFDGNKMLRSIELSVANAEPRLLGFVSPAQFAVVWKQGMSRGVEVWDARAGTRGKQVPLPDFLNERGNLNPTVDPRVYGIATQSEGKNVLQLVDLTGLRAARKFNVTSIDPRWPLKTGGIALSPDGSKVATIFENDKDALIVVYRSSDGKILSEGPCAPGVLPAAADSFTGSAIQWMDEEGPLLVYGTAVDLAGQRIGAIVDDRATLGQAFVNKECAVILLRGSSKDTFDVAVVKYAAPKPTAK